MAASRLVKLFCVRKRRSASGPTARDHLLFSSQREPGDEVTLEDCTLRRNLQTRWLMCTYLRITTCFNRPHWHSWSLKLCYSHFWRKATFEILYLQKNVWITSQQTLMTEKPYLFFVVLTQFIHDTWVSVTTAWRVLMLRMEERPLIWRVAANILNKQSRTSDKRWSSSLGYKRGANKSPP